MAIKPFVKGAQIQAQPTQTRFKPFVQVQRAPQRQDVRQSQNYLNAQSQADKYAQEAKKASSFGGMALNTLKAIPKATLDVAVGTIPRFAASVAEIPGIVARGGQTSQREYKIPGLSPFKSYQSDFQNIAGDVIEGKKGLGSAAWSMAQPVLGGAELLGIGKGLGRAKTALKGGQLKTAGLEALDAFVPTTRGVKAKGVSPLETLQKGKSKTIPLDARKPLPKEFSLKSSYKQIQSQADKNVNPLIQEARKGDVYYHATTDKGAKGIESQGFKAMLGERSQWGEGGLTKGKGVWLYPSEGKDAGKKGAEDFLNNFIVKEGGRGKVLETKVNGKVFQLTGDRDVQKMAGNSKFINKLKKEGYVGIEGEELGQTQTFIFEPKAIKVSQPLQEGVESLAKKADEIINPLKPKAKDRKFIETIRKSKEVSTDLKSRVDETYNVRHNKAAQEKAQRLIFENPLEAERIAKGGANDDAVFTANELVKHYDDIAKTAKETGNMADFEVAMNKAVEITQENAKNLTEAGRAVQAASTINKLSPDGIIAYVNKAVRDVGGDFRLSNEKYYDIVRQAEEIKGILDPRQKALKTFDLLDSIYADIPLSLKNKVSEALNLPRAIMATADLSAPLRQGIFSAARNPKMFAKNFVTMFKYALSEDAYRGLKADIITSPNYNLYVKHKLPLTDISQQLTGREEQFLSSWAEKIPGFGKLAKGSNRAYSGFLNKMRMDLFDDFVKTAKMEGIKDPKFFDDASKFVGSATGRGRLWESVEPHAGLLNGIFFSPRLMASRANLLNPVYYTKLHPTVRKEALKTLASFVGTGMSVLGLAKLNGADVSFDPRSADFGKIKIGKTRYDIWGGFQQYARFLGQMITGEKISTTTGKETQLGAGGYNAPTRESITKDFFSSKFNPIASLVSRGLKGEQFGEKFNLPAELIDRFIPMIASDAFDLMKEYGTVQGAAMAVPGAFGVGSQTYGDQIPKFTETASGNVGIEYRSEPGLGETILNKITGEQVSDVPQELWKPLAEERLAEQKRQAEVDKGKQMTLITGEPRQVGDTYIYLDNGIVKTKKTSKEKRLPKKDELIKQAIEKRKTNPFYQ